MKDKIILILKGIIVGLGKIIPGVSGAMLAITLGIYDKCIEAISNFTKNIKNNINLLFYIGLGIVISVGMFSNMVIYLLNNHYFLTMCLFIGLIVGGIPKLYSESKINVNNFSNIILIIGSFLIMIIINFNNFNYIIKMDANIITLIGLGLLESLAMIVPGISGTALLMLIGYYDLVILRFSQIFNIMTIFETISFFVPFGFGMLIGTLIISKIINYLFKNYHIKTYCLILGIVLSSTFILISTTFKNNLTLSNTLLGILFILIGTAISYFLEYILKK